MSVSAARNVSLVLMLVAFPLISIGTTSDRPMLWGLGLASLALGALMPPLMRYLPEEKEEAAPAREPTDLGDSCRVC